MIPGTSAKFDKLEVLRFAEPFLAFADGAQLGEVAGEVILQLLDERRGPLSAGGDADWTIHLVGVSRDGLMDLVQVKNGDFCYWP